MANSKSLTNPFPGLRPFEKDEYHLFFGRESHIDTVLHKLNARKFVCVVGNSGSGKSSLVRAGILPKLKSNAEEKWHICTMRPGSNPVQALYDSIFSNPSFIDGKAELISNVSVLKKNTKGLIQAVRPFLADGSKLLILADQFEELFRFVSEQEGSDFEEATHFVNLLLEASAERSVDIHVMMTIRSDFLGDCERFYGLPEAINDAQFLVPRLNRKELQRIIEGPVEYAGAKISPRLVQKLLNSIGTKTDLLPILQHLLNRLWSTWESQTNSNKDIPIDIEHYERIGGIDAAMSNHLEEVLSEFDTEKTAIIENLFKTLTLKGADNRGVRRPTKLNVLSEILRVETEKLTPIIDAFRLLDRGFIMPPSTVQLVSDTVIDISHESLMRVWPRLIQWADEEQDSLGLYDRLCESAKLFEKGKSGLWRDPDLALGLSWLNDPRHTKKWSELYNEDYNSATQFLKASKQNAEFEIAEKQRKKRVFQSVLTGSSIVMAGLTIFSFMQKNSADEATIKAEESSLKANEQAKIAQIEKQNAIKQKSIAEIQKLKAEEQKDLAEQERINALNQKKNALAQKEIANAQRLLAQSEQKKAEKAREVTQKALEDAKKANKEREEALKKAVASETKAQKSKNYALSKSVAIKSKLLNARNQSGLKVALASEALNIFRSSGRPMFDRDIHGALLDAKLSKTGENYNTNFIHTMECRSILVTEEYTISVGLDGRIHVVTNGTKNVVSTVVIEGLALYKVIALKDENSLAILADKNKVYTIAYDKTNGQLDKSTLKKVATSESGIIDIHSSNQDIIYATNREVVQLTNDGKELSRINISQGISAFTISDESLSTLFISSMKGEILRLSLSDKIPKLVQSYAGFGMVNSICIKKGYLYLGSTEGKCKQISLGQDLKEFDFPGHTAGVTDMVVSENGKFLATASFDGLVRVYSLENKRESPLEISHHKSWVYDVAISSTNDKVYSAGRDRKVKQFKIRLSDLEKDLEEYKVEPLSEAQRVRYIGE